MPYGLVKSNFFDNDFLKELKFFGTSLNTLKEALELGGNEGDSGFVARGDGKGYIFSRKVRKNKDYKYNTKCTYEEVDGMEFVKVETEYKNSTDTANGYESFSISIPMDADSNTIKVDSFPDGYIEINIEKKCMCNGQKD